LHFRDQPSNTRGGLDAPLVSALVPCDAIPDDADADANEVLLDVLTEMGDVLETAGVAYGLIGGVASSAYGRPRTTRDIDVFLKPIDADRALTALAKSGFACDRLDPKWIFKARKHGVLVDLIFATGKGIYFDDEMLERCTIGSFRGRRVRLVAPEDLLIIKASVHDEATPRHWFDAIGILGARELDWDYLLYRSRRAQKRVLSLLLYAESLDYAVPERVMRALFERIQEG
jgi:predicted nucleotidyltransferase